MFLSVRRYNDSMKLRWDEFVQESKNATFLFFRNYMDYHSDRFIDNSLMVYDKNDQLFALLPR